MRYKKGSIVEVLGKNELPSGSWRCAEIIYGNGHNYTVKYNLDSGNTSEAVVERVSRKSIRPCPPPVELLEDWVPGDILEVYHNFSWKMGIVSKLLGRKYFLVRLIGSSHEFKISKLYLRVRQCWHGNKWIVIRKSFHKSEDGSKYNQMVSPQAKKKDRRMNLLAKDELPARSKNFEESYIIPSRTLKRALPNGNFQVEAPVKFRAIEKEDRHRRFLAENQTPLPVKVDTVASLRVMKGEKHIHASINHRTAHLTEVDEREKSSGALGFSHAIRTEVGGCTPCFQISRDDPGGTFEPWMCSSKGCRTGIMWLQGIP
ncbi:uncharacterized protein LOC127806170 isoform X2 [Diospyros lotus]|uniref:uncharacterized protein LOC127806170 isoform X2 n=1 Tax=Diospyros lotus TaxID=55363 RepID=UPI00225210FD|nr:uncharacterized protein LOC127806170 isoform X2 [Diospyros lotus]XP_052199235.1 uncharacterized protein LOC127806170 isoform X2 [Diospyros lotus]